MVEIFGSHQKPAGEFAPCDPPDLLARLVRLAETHGIPPNEGAALQPLLPRVLVDGPSGSGKSTLAKYLAKQLGAEFVQLDNVYASWDGLAEAGQRVATDLLKPLQAGLPGRIRHWDWDADAPAGWQEVSPDLPLVVEGSAALNTQTAQLATFRIWVEVPDAQARKQRALEQRPGGDVYAPYWEYWGKQEAAHIAQHNSRELADVHVLPGVMPADPLYRLLGVSRNLHF